MVLFGGGETGKSTLYTQLKILLGVLEISPDSIRNCKDRHLQIFISHCHDLVRYARANVQSHDFVDPFKELPHSEFPFPKNGGIKIDWLPFLNSNNQELLTNFWGQDSVQDMWRNTVAPHSQAEAVQYFVSNLERLCDARSPMEIDDLLFAQIRTFGLYSASCTQANMRLEVIDTGGQRSERRKWPSIAPTPSCIIFVASASEFNEILYEDHNKNRWKESLECLTSVARSDIWKDVPIVLVLNKVDVLERKLLWFKETKTSLDDYFPELELGSNHDGSLDIVLKHLTKRLEECVPRTRLLGCYHTSAVKHETRVVLRNLLRRIGVAEDFLHIEESTIKQPKVLRMISSVRVEPDPTIMLFGMSRAGKTTLLKQAMLSRGAVNLNDTAIKTNVVEGFLASFYQLLDAVLEKYLPVQGSALHEYRKRRAGFLRFRSPEEKKSMLLELWKSIEFREMLQNFSDDGVSKTVSYFFQNFDSVYCDQAISEHDFLYSCSATRSPTTTSLHFKDSKILFKEVPASHYRNRSWQNSVHKVSGVVHLVSVANVLEKLPDYWRETVTDFKNVMNSKMCEQIPVIVLLTKIDILQVKLKQCEKEQVNLNQYFPELRLKYDYDFAFETILQFLQGDLLSHVTPNRILGCYHINTLDNKISNVIDALVQKLCLENS